MIVKVGDTSVATFDEARTALQGASGPTPSSTSATAKPSQHGRRRHQNAAVHRRGRRADHRRRHRYRRRAVRADAVQPVVGGPGHVRVHRDLAVELAKSLAKIPTKIGALVHSIGGGERDPETPISVVGASIIGGDTVDAGLWVAFWFFLAQLNFVLGAINLVPLLPFDGGHIAVAWYEKIRNMIRSARGKVAAAPVNYLKLMPATYVILFVVVGYMLLTVTADLVNPIRLFQ